jgi:hypothetical protein
VVHPEYFKAGVSVNKTYMLSESHLRFQTYYPVYPSLNLSYEKAWLKRSAWVLNLEALRKSLEFNYDNVTQSSDYKINVLQFSFIPEYRVYLRSKDRQPVTDGGCFIQAGFELFHYSVWDDGKSQGSGFDLYPNNLTGWFERNVPVGFGFKLPLKNGNGFEMNLNTNLAQIAAQGNDQTVSLGVKYFWKRK